MKNNISITLLAILANIVWATAVLTAKLGFNFLGPCSLAGVRLLISGLFILLISGNILININTIVKHIKELSLISLFQSFFTFLFIYIGLTFVSGSIATIVLGFEPAICALLAHVILKNDKLSKNKIISITISLIGITLISLTTKPWTPLGIKPFIGIILIIIGIASSGIGNILILTNKSKIDYKLLNASQSLLSAIPFLLIGFLFEKNNFAITNISFIIMIIWISLISIISSNIWTYLLKVKKAKVSYINMWGFLNPVVGTVLCLLFIPNEHFSLITIIGIFTVLVSLIFLFKSKEKKVYIVNE